MSVKHKAKIIPFNNPIFFVTVDVNWALGLMDWVSDYHIICYEDHPLLDLLSSKVKVFCLEREFSHLKCPKNTGSMLMLPEVQSYIEDHSGKFNPWVMFFKPSPMIDKVCLDKGYLQIGNSSVLNRKWENKLELVRLGNKYSDLNVVPSEIKKLEELMFKDRMVIQTARGWAGKSTFVISSKEELDNLKSKLGEVKVKVSPFIAGRTYINNACLVGEKVIKSLPALQINCTQAKVDDLNMSTCGRQWPVDLSDEIFKEINRITDKVGSLMGEEGYKGYFGLDFLVDSKSDNVYLQEINPRLTASSSFYSKLETKAGVTSLLWWHLMSFVEKEIQKYATADIVYGEKISGLQLVLRNEEKVKVRLQNQIKPGIYKLSDGEFNFLRPSYEVTEIKAVDEFLLVSPAKGSTVSVKSELLRCETCFPLSEEDFVILKNALVKLKDFLV